MESNKYFNHIEKNKIRLDKYELFREFENIHLDGSLYSNLKKGFSEENPKLKYENFLRYYFLHFTFVNKIEFNDLILLAVQKNDISLIFYSVYLISQFIEETPPRELQDLFIQSYIALEQISDNVKDDILFLFDTGLLKTYQLDFFKEILNDLPIRYKAFKGTYQVKLEPYFHFEYISF